LPFPNALRAHSSHEFQTTRYGRVAAIWDALERLSLQPLSRVRNAFVDRLPSRLRNPLIAGCGTGQFAVSLIRGQNPPRITLNDLAPEMVARAARRVRDSGWTGTVIASTEDMTDLRPAEPYDFIALQFVLTCFPQQSRARLIERMRSCASPDAIWLIGDYSRPQHAALLPVFHVLFFAAVVLFWLLGANSFERPGDTEKAILAGGLEIIDRYQVAGGLYTAWLARFP
jgi:ubiquinone/menaquinone biosynthesis C-methylase UbiE